jgi:hypothetical protein
MRTGAIPVRLYLFLNPFKIATAAFKSSASAYIIYKHSANAQQGREQRLYTSEDNIRLRRELCEYMMITV